MLRSRLERVADAAASIAGATVVGLMIAQFIVVVLRYGFSVGVQWSQDLLVYLFMLASVLPLAAVVMANRVVRVDILYSKFSLKQKSAIDRFGLGALLFPVSAYSAYISWHPLLNSWALLEGSATLGGLPGLFILKTVLFLTFVTLALVAVVLIVRNPPWDYGANHGRDQECDEDPV